MSAILREHDVEQVDVLKLDCEGSEYDILLGCDPENLRRIMHIAMEIHEVPSIHTRAELVDLRSPTDSPGDLRRG